ncbi:MAG: hypothetical protein JSW43_06790 [Gemmatimonadota bacterium]|nr:MAG: hypothetical protein JSW43_06790 [Gemmatimonadota bacterium]
MNERRHVFSFVDPNRRLPPSAVVLIVANFVPIYGVAYLGWEVFPVILLFWFENVVIGFYNALKMAFASPGDIARWLGKLFMIPFFAVHYGLFCFVHGIFVVVLFGRGTVESLDNPGVGMFVGALTAAGVTWAAAALFVSHGFSFAWNYVGKGEYRRAGLEELMTQPYARVVVLHLVLLTSAFLVMTLGLPAIGLVLLVLLKIGVDLNAHLKERARFTDKKEE